MPYLDSSYAVIGGCQEHPRDLRYLTSGLSKVKSELYHSISTVGLISDQTGFQIDYRMNISQSCTVFSSVLGTLCILNGLWTFREGVQQFSTPLPQSWGNGKKYIKNSPETFITKLPII